MPMTKADRKIRREESITMLRDLLPKGTMLYTYRFRKTPTAKKNQIKVLYIGEDGWLNDISMRVSFALGLSLNQNFGTVQTEDSGCGLVQQLEFTLFQETNSLRQRDV
jgi:hypothetical protein